jgi:DNA-binding IclR family transcriptional regulator
VAATDNAPRSIERMFRMFESLRSTPDGMTLAEVSTELGTPKSSTLRLLRVLTQAEYLIHSPPRYTLGPAIFRFAAGLMAVREFPTLIRPCMQRLQEMTQETIYVAVLDTDEKAAKYLDVLESPQPIRYSVQAGTSRPLYCSSAGRLLLAYQPKPWIDSYLETTKLRPITAKTLVSVRELRQELKSIRYEGLATSFGEAVPGAAGIAAPIFDRDGTLKAALMVGGPEDRMSLRMKDYVPALVAAADDASSLLGHKPTVRRKA